MQGYESVNQDRSRCCRFGRSLGDRESGVGVGGEQPHRSKILDTEGSRG